MKSKQVVLAAVKLWFFSPSKLEITYYHSSKGKK